MRKLGSLQRKVLESVRDFGSPWRSMKSSNYTEWHRRAAVSRELERRGLITSYPYGHPEIVRLHKLDLADGGRGHDLPVYWLTDAGKQLL